MFDWCSYSVARSFYILAIIVLLGHVALVVGWILGYGNDLVPIRDVSLWIMVPINLILPIVWKYKDRKNRHDIMGSFMMWFSSVIVAGLNSLTIMQAQLNLVEVFEPGRLGNIYFIAFAANFVYVIFLVAGIRKGLNLKKPKKESRPTPPPA